MYRNEGQEILLGQILRKCHREGAKIEFDNGAMFLELQSDTGGTRCK